MNAYIGKFYSKSWKNRSGDLEIRMYCLAENETDAKFNFSNRIRNDSVNVLERLRLSTIGIDIYYGEKLNLLEKFKRNNPNAVIVHFDNDTFQEVKDDDIIINLIIDRISIKLVNTENIIFETEDDRREGCNTQ